MERVFAALPELRGNAARYAGLERQRNYDRLDSMADHRLVQGLSAASSDIMPRCSAMVMRRRRLGYTRSYCSVTLLYR